MSTEVKAEDEAAAADTLEIENVGGRWVWFGGQGGQVRPPKIKDPKKTRNKFKNPPQTGSRTQNRKKLFKKLRDT